MTHNLSADMSADKDSIDYHFYDYDYLVSKFEFQTVIFLSDSDC